MLLAALVELVVAQLGDARFEIAHVHDELDLGAVDVRHEMRKLRLRFGVVLLVAEQREFEALGRGRAAGERCSDED